MGLNFRLIRTDEAIKVEKMSMPTGIFFWISFSVQMISICPAKGNRCSEQCVNSLLVKVVIDQIQVLCVA